MALVLPYPNKPANGDTLDATVVQANITAITQAIQSFDGSQVQAASIQAAAIAAAANPVTRGGENFVNYIANAGAVIGIVSGLNVTISGAIMYINGTRLVFAGVGSQTVVANKDTYVDVDNLGNITYQAVSNNAASPAITANSIRIGVIVSGASTISFINQGQTDTSLVGFAPFVSSNYLTHTDTLGNIIYPTDPVGRLLGYRQLNASFNAPTTALQDIVGLNACPAITPLGRRIKIILSLPHFYSSVDSNRIDYAIAEDSVILQNSYNRTWTAGNGGNGNHVLEKKKMVSSAGLHIYKSQVATGIGAGLATVYANGVAPFAYPSLSVELM